MFYQVPGNTQKKSARAIPTEPDDHCSADSGKTCDDIEILALLGDATTNSAANGSNNDITAASEGETKIQVRTLGGMRLRLRYIKPSIEGAQITKVTWRMGKTGCFYTEYGVNKDACSGTKKEVDTDYEVTGTADKVDWSVYWEPLNSDNKTDWSNWAGTQTSDEGVKCTLKAEYTLPVTGADGKVTQVAQTPYEKDFYIKTRELKPPAGKEKAMQGSDVAMLEAVLWQLGISPQKNSMGKGGARINSDRGVYKKKALGWTKNCDGTKADTRNTYSAGWDSCLKGNVALEGMVRRFQGRNVSNVSGEETNGGKGQSGIVSNNTLVQLNRVWTEYWSSYSKNKATPQILVTALTDDWLKEGTTIWESGLGTQAAATYTQTEHKAMLKAAGLNDDAKTRETLLRNWKAQETSSHWGEGSPITNYRMTEGSGDEYGSLSFNQVLFQYRYSDQPCKGHKDSGLNFYEPIDNIKGFALHTALNPTSENNCPGSFYRAYVAKNLTKTHGTDKPLKYRHGTTGAWKDVGTTDDSYELLAKAIGGYNGGMNLFSKYTWAKLILSTHKPTGAERTNVLNGTCFSCEYSISVRNVKYGLPYRQYLWKGGVEPDTIPVLGDDGKQIEVNGVDLSPKNKAMTRMRFPINLTGWRSHYEKALYRRTNHQSH